VVAVLLEHLFGLLTGALAGRWIGYYLGRLYADSVEPVYLRDLSELASCQLIPETWAAIGVACGASAGLLLVAFFNRRLLRKGARTLVEGSVTWASRVAMAAECGRLGTAKLPQG